MYEEIAWNNFCKTGDLESFLQYKEYKRTLEKTKDLPTIKDKGGPLA